jgi:hypothetical protein
LISVMPVGAPFPVLSQNAYLIRHKTMNPDPLQLAI